jgi:hypothetical protein
VSWGHSAGGLPADAAHRASPNPIRVIRCAGLSASGDVATTTLLGSFALDTPDRLHDLIRMARAGSPEAVAEVVRGVQDAITAVWPEITAATVVPVPRHVPGPAHELVVTTCQAIVNARGWSLDSDALRRTIPSPEAKAGGRRDPETEAATLTWDRATLGRVIVLVDDVIRTGATIQSCVRVVRATGDERLVLAIALARARDLRPRYRRQDHRGPR